MSQKPSETVDQFVVRVKNKADKCSFQADHKDDRITEEVINGILWKEEKKLSGKGHDLTLTVTIGMSEGFEASKQNLNRYDSNIGSDIRAIEDIGLKHKPKPAYQIPSQSSCTRSGIIHLPRKCPAYRSICSKCKKKGH